MRGISEGQIKNTGLFESVHLNSCFLGGVVFIGVSESVT